MPLINGTAGDDTLNGTVDADEIYGLDGNDIIYAGGGGFPGIDWIYDGPGDDTVFGEADMDVIYGSPGNDTYDGGTGTSGFHGLDIDSVHYESALAGIVVDLRLSIGQVRSAGNGDAAAIGVDTLINIEEVYGSNFDDTMRAADGSAGNAALYGQGGNDTLIGGSGADILSGGAGDDLLDGGGGRDMAVYRLASAGVTVSLAISGPQDTGEGIDTLISIEDLFGSTHDDLLIGNGGNNYLFGDRGNDILIGGAGFDILEGFTGDDIYIFESASDYALDVIEDFDGWDEIRFAATVTSTLTLKPQEGIDGIVIGTGFGTTADTTGLIALNVDASGASNRILIIGNDGANTLLATAFNDTVFGGGGDDQLSGLAGVDTLTGGAGADTFRDTSAGLDGDTITDFARGDRIVLADATLGLSVGLTMASSGSQLTYGSASIFLSNVRNPSIAISAAPEGGVQIVFGGPPIIFSSTVVSDNSTWGTSPSQMRLAASREIPVQSTEQVFLFGAAQFPDPLILQTDSLFVVS